MISLELENSLILELQFVLITLIRTRSYSFITGMWLLYYQKENISKKILFNHSGLEISTSNTDVLVGRGSLVYSCSNLMTLHN